jgi:hypothetical protein
MTRQQLAHALGALAFLFFLLLLATAACPGCAAAPVRAGLVPARTPPAATPAAAPEPAPVRAGLVPALTVPDPAVHEQHYRLRCQAGPTIAGITPGWFSAVECRVPLAELRQRLDLAAAAARAAEDAAGRHLLRWYFGAPLLAVGLILLILGAYLTVKGADLGADAALLGIAAAAPGLVLILYPRQAGYAGAAATALVIGHALWRAHGRARARRAATTAHAATADLVGCLDQLRLDLGDPEWKAKIAPILRHQLPETTDLVRRLQDANLMHDTEPEPLAGHP